MTRVFLVLHLITCGLHASAAPQDLSQDKSKERTSPYTYVSNSDCIINGNFYLMPILPGSVEDLATKMARTCSNKNIMKFYGKGRTVGLNGLVLMFERYATLNEQISPPYYWIVMTHKGVSGVFLTYPAEDNSIVKEVREISRILIADEKRVGLGSALLRTVCGAEEFSAIDWRAKSHPDNIASRKSRENAGFIHVETKYDEQDRGIRIFDYRPSKDEIDGRTSIYFSYSCNSVPLAYLEGKMPLSKLLSFTTRHFSVCPLTTGILKSVSLSQLNNLFNTGALIDQERLLRSTDTRDLLEHLKFGSIYETFN